MRRSEGTRFSSTSNDEVGDCQARSARSERSNQTPSSARRKRDLTEDDAAYMRKCWATYTGTWRSSPRETLATRPGGTR